MWRKRTRNMSDLIDLAEVIFARYIELPDVGGSSWGLSMEEQSQYREAIRGMEPDAIPVKFVADITSRISQSDRPKKACEWFLREIDIVHGASYFHLFRMRSTGDVLVAEKGQLVPLARPNLKELGIHYPSSRQTGFGFSRIPQEIDYKIQLDFSWAAQLKALFHPELKLAAAVLNRSLEENYTLRSDQGQFWLELKSVQIQMDRLEAALTEATGLCIDILLLPELSLPVEASEMLQRHTEGNEFPRVVVGGFVHQSLADGDFLNECGAWSCGRELRQAKRRPFELSKEGLREKLGSLGERPFCLAVDDVTFTMAAAICCDFLLDICLVPQTMVACGVNLAMVPAWSQKTDLFRQKSTSLKSSTQALTVVSNSCPEPGAKLVCHAALVDVPQDNFEPCLYQWVDGTPPPQLFVFRLNESNKS